MTVKEIYQKFKIPPNLQEHMLRVAALALYIGNNWKDKSIDKDKLLKLALLHDLGNIVKFDLDNRANLLGKEIKNKNLWKKVQMEIKSKYGETDHEATSNMLEEIGIDEATRELIRQKSFGNSLETEKSTDWELKVVYYSDLRSAPYGVTSLEERINEAIPRLEKYKNLENLNELINACKLIELQISKRAKIDILKISEESLKSTSQGLLNTTVTH